MKACLLEKQWRRFGQCHTMPEHNKKEGVDEKHREILMIEAG